MSDIASLTKNATSLWVHCLLFIPKGFFYPIASFSDYLQSSLFQRKIACHHCEYGANQIVPVNQKRLDTIFNIAHHALYRMFSPLVELIAWGINKAVRRSVFDKIEPFFEWLIVKKDRLENNKGILVWKYAIPFALVGGAASIWGVLIIPEIYLFFLASFWVGKILNSCANFLVRRQHSQEWNFIKSLLHVLLGRKSMRDFFQEYRKPSSSLAKQLLLDFLIIGLLRRFSDFIYYCTEAFFAWLALYVLIKTAAEEAPLMLDTLEGYLAEFEQEEELGFGHQLTNATWLVVYHSFEKVGSSASLEAYRELHWLSQHSDRTHNEVGQLINSRNSLSQSV